MNTRQVNAALAFGSPVVSFAGGLDVLPSFASIFQYQESYVMKCTLKLLRVELERNIQSNCIKIQFFCGEKIILLLIRFL